MTERVCLIDGSGYIFRAYFASPEMTNPEGLPVNAVYGFLNMFLSLTKNIKCDYCLVLFDAKRENFRNAIFKDYKATRPPLPDNLKPQFQLIHEVVEALNLKWLQMEGYEADDLIASYTAKALSEGKEVTIVSADKDLMQLIREGVSFYDGMKNKYFSADDVKEKFGVYPEHVVDVQAMAGDATDNIPGIPGIGIKTAAELVNQFGSLQGVLENAHQIKQNKRRELIINHQEDARVSLQLVTLKSDIELPFGINEMKCTAPDEDVLIALLERHAFKSLKNKALSWLHERSCLPVSQKKIDRNYRVILDNKELEKLKEKIYEENVFSFYPVIDKENNLIGMSVSLKEAEGYYIPLVKEMEVVDLFSQPAVLEGITKGELINFLEPLFKHKAVLKIAMNFKDTLKLLDRTLGIELASFPYDDVGIMAYSLGSTEFSVDLASLLEYFLSTNLKVFNAEYKKADFATFEVKDVCELFGEVADYILRLHGVLKEALFKEKSLYVYDVIDKPLAQILLEMERAGVMLDIRRLRELDNLFDKAMSELSQEIFTLSGETFNLSSPKQIGEILYNKLGLKGKKHTSGSLNTSAEVLEQMAETHVVPQKIIEWRQYQKLKTTYSSALLEQIDVNHRVHTTYNQTSVNTGRLSSFNPNLQNIPIRTTLGREIRNCFIAKKGYKIVAADYSQVELRLLATMADVKFLQTAFLEGVDIHKKTASEVFNVAYDAVDNTLRRRAKAINFGIVYGMSAFGLSKEIDSTTKEAEDYMRAYFASMPEVKVYMDKVIAFAHQHGYVLTPFGRKIPIYGINDNNKKLASFAERAAINAPVQGGAADIIKLAMQKVFLRLNQHQLKARMLLQVHDELVFEVPEEEVDEAIYLIKKTMEDVSGIELKVPLIASADVGDNWGEAH